MQFYMFCVREMSFKGKIVWKEVDNTSTYYYVIGQ